MKNDRCKMHLKLFILKKTLRIVLLEDLVIWIKVLASDSEMDQTLQYGISEVWVSRLQI